MQVETSGTQSATVGTEHTLATVTGAKVLVLIVDTANLALGETLELRVKIKVLTAGTVRQAYMAAYQHAQSDPIKFSIPVPSPFSADFTLKQTSGTGRSYDWSVVSI
jgi:hypothetical protein